MAERKDLTAAEKKRLEAFNKKEAELLAAGWRKQDLTVGPVAGNILAVVVSLPAAALAVFLYFRNGGTLESYSILLFLVLFAAGIGIHEGIHGLFCGIFAPDHFRSVSFGFNVQAMAPYCSCRSPLAKWQYIIMGAMPTVLLGWIPAATAVITRSNLLLTLAVCMILGGGGDFLIIFKLLLHRGKGQSLYLDHPTEIGVVCFEKGAD